MNSFHQLVEAFNLINEFENVASKHRKGKGKNYVLNDQLTVANCKKFANYHDSTLSMDTSFAISSIARKFDKLVSEIKSNKIAKVSDNG